MLLAGRCHLGISIEDWESKGRSKGPESHLGVRSPTLRSGLKVRGLEVMLGDQRSQLEVRIQG